MTSCAHNFDQMSKGTYSRFKSAMDVVEIFFF